MSSNSSPRVALVIPNYFDADTILETLQSVQEPEDVEVIVVDDATPDPTAIDKLRAYEEQGLIDTLILCTENGGTARATNAGVAATSARYVCPFGNDDLLVPGALTALADALDADPEAAFAVGHFEYFGTRPGLRESAPWDPWRALGRNAWPGSMMARRDVFLQLGGFTSDCIAQDWDFYLGCASKGLRGVVIPRVVYRYRIHEHNHRLSADARRAYRNEARVVRRRHADLYARERELRRKSDAGWRERWFWTLMIKIAPHRPPWATDVFFHVASLVARVRRIGRARTANVE